jgi:hypothetical protein
MRGTSVRTVVEGMPTQPVAALLVRRVRSPSELGRYAGVTLRGYRSVVHVFICYVGFAEALRQVLKAGSKIIEVVRARKIVAQPRPGRGHHDFHPP